MKLIFSFYFFIHINYKNFNNKFCCDLELHIRVGCDILKRGRGVLVYKLDDNKNECNTDDERSYKDIGKFMLVMTICE